MVLEEALAKLLSHNGYSLLVDSKQDPDALVGQPGSLRVLGRGTSHQVDVLGELLAPVPFGLPLRLFVEGKCRATPTELSDVRNAHGVIYDVNQQFATAALDSESIPLRRHEYKYSLFSTSGFTDNAQAFALAQQISLVDLSGPGFLGLRGAVTRAAVILHDHAEQNGITNFPVRLVRTGLRLVLGTWTATSNVGASSPRLDYESAKSLLEETTVFGDVQDSVASSNRLSTEVLASVGVDLADDLGEALWLGFPPTSFVLVLRPDDGNQFDGYVQQHGSTLDVDIRFARGSGTEGDWVLVPADGSEAFVLRFGLPVALLQWLLAEDGAGGARARDLRRGMFSSITVFRARHAVTLNYAPVHVPTRQNVGMPPHEETRSTPAPLELELESPQYALSEERQNEIEVALSGEREGDQLLSSPSPERWPKEVVSEFMRRLDNGGYAAQAAVIRAAARNENRRVSRAEAYTLAGWNTGRSLRGFTRPTNRISVDLEEEGRLAREASYPIYTVYPQGGVRASAFEVPADVAEALNAPDD